MPARNKKNTKRDPSSSSGPSRPRPKPLEQRDPTGIPGISKLKAQIRQTKRLLAKENLEPGLRLTTQRRLTSLEADLAHASKRNIEKKNGGKYHMVKFFERQKLLRIIKRANKSLADESTKKSKRKALEQDLADARVMLNYVLHFPNEKKYIAIFPAAKTESSGNEKLILPPLLRQSSVPEEKGEKRRYEILQAIQEKMAAGHLPAEPEKEGRGEAHIDVLPSEVAVKVDEKVKTKEEEEDDFFEEE